MTVQSLPLLGTFCQGCDDLAEREKRLVDVDGFFRGKSGVASLAVSLATSQID